MKKRIILLFVVTSVFSLVWLYFNASLKAQDKTSKAENSALEAYAKWRDSSLKRKPRGVATPHFALAVVSQKLSENTARIEYVIAGNMKGIVLEVVPEIVIFLQGNQVQRRLTEGGTSVKQSISSEKGGGHKIYDSSAEFIIGEGTNALLIKWMPVDGVERTPGTFEILLNYEPYSGATGSILSQTADSNVSKLSFGNSFLSGKALLYGACEEVSMTCPGNPNCTGEQCKKCGGTIGNSTSCVNCTITRGSACSSGEDCM